MRCIFVLLILLFSGFTTEVSAKIYICVDDAGKRHYSDKRCPTTSGKKSESYSMTDKVIAPRNVVAFTAVLKLSRESLALLMILEPQDGTYKVLYNDISKAQTRHRQFIASPQRSRFRGYNPMGLALQNRLIASMSKACRQRGHMSICGAIEGNPWFSIQESDFYNANSISRAMVNKYCEKANRAHEGGVISNQMRTSFCQQQNDQ